MAIAPSATTEGDAVSPKHHRGHTDLQNIYSTRCHRKAKKIIKDLSYPKHGLFTPLPSRRQRPYMCIKAGTIRLLHSQYYPASTKYPALKLRAAFYLQSH
jgi:hypothetical protein